MEEMEEASDEAEWGLDERAAEVKGISIAQYKSLANVAKEKERK